MGEGFGRAQLFEDMIKSLKNQFRAEADAAQRVIAASVEQYFRVG